MAASQQRLRGKFEESRESGTESRSEAKEEEEEEAATEKRERERESMGFEEMRRKEWERRAKMRWKHVDEQTEVEIDSRRIEEDGRDGWMRMGAEGGR
ncbi:hypothetical protein RUM43_001890 [Polyplax serrata]|uniref:Uncharacterized protein n=1 Tax=Polyplax serrata TaxID=468196 RepID=A0AAN8XRJ3_POLSC